MSERAFNRIAKALAVMGAERRLEVAFRAAVPARLVHRLAQTVGHIVVRPFDGATYIQICAAIGRDPVTGDVTQNTANLGLFLPEHLACASKLARLDVGLSLRKAERKWKVEQTALCRMENGIAVSIEPLLGLCKALKRHPFDFLQPRDFPGSSHGKHKLQHVENTKERVVA